MGICQAVAEAASGIRAGVQSPVGNGLLNVLNAIGAADIAIRLGSGGQAGLTDLPGMFNTAGIPCYSPQLGDTIYVTPTQWYANGMSCEGLRDPDREALERRIRELQEAAEARNRIRQNHDITLPPNINSQVSNGLNEELNRNNAFFNNGFRNPNGSLEFLAAGILSLSQVTGETIFTAGGWTDGEGNWNPSGFPNSSYSSPSTKEINVQPGDKIVPTRTSWSDSFGGWTELSWVLKRPGFSDTLVENRFVSSNQNFLGQSSSYSGRYLYQGVGVRGTLAEYGFSATPSATAPPTTNGFESNFPIAPPIRPEPPEEPCMGGCSCGQMANQQQRQNQNLERLIREIHTAVSASKFANGAFMFQPEQLIESQGKTLYGQNPGRGGSVKVGNLLEAVSAAISSHYHRSGLHRFPAKVPDSLIPMTNDAAEAADVIDDITLHDAMGWQEWWFKQWEAATGQYPIEYEITDDGQKKKVKLWNQSEVLGEIFGMGLKIQEDSDLGVQWGVRAATEASKSGNAALKTLHLLQEYVKWSGCLTSNGKDDFIKVTSTFSPDPDADPTKAEEMLKPSKQDLQVTNIVDGRSLLGLLMNINYWTQISGKANFGDMGAANPLVQSPRQTTNMPGDGIKEIRKKERANDRKWDEWKRQKQQPNTTVPQGQQPPGGLPTPNIVEIPRQNQQA